MVNLISEKYGPVLPGDRFSGGEVGIDLLIRPGFQVEMLTLRIKSDDRIDFRGIPWPYTVIFIFGYSVVLYLSGSLKKEIHDRGSHLFYNRDNSYKIRFQKDRDYLIFSIHYASDFIRQNLEEMAQSIRTSWELNAPVFYYSRARIIKRTVIEQLSMLTVPVHPGLMNDFAKDELARIIVMDFLNELDISFQPSYIGASQFQNFYAEKDRLVSIAHKPLPVSELLALSEIKQIPMFRKRMRQLYDLNIREFITELRMNMAMMLLKDPTLSVKEIAYQTGFSSAFYFSRVFSNYYGLPPTHFHAKRDV